MASQTIQVIAFIAVLFWVIVACNPTPEPEGPGSTGNTITLYVDSEQVDCVGVAPQKCLRVKTDPDGEWQLFYAPIEGFEYEEGFVYELKVNSFDVPNPPADGSSIRYELVEVVSKEAVE